MDTPHFWARREQGRAVGYYLTVCNGEELVLSGFSGNDLVNLIDVFSRMRMLSPSPVSADFYNTDAGRVTVLRSEDDGYTDAVYSIVANGRMVELTHEQFNAVIQALEQAYKADVDTVLFPTFSSGIYFTKEYGAETADSYKGRMASVALHVKGMRIDASTEKEARLLHRLLCQLESGEAAVVMFAEHFICYNAGAFWLHDFDRAPVLLTPAELVDMRRGLGTALNYAESVPSWYPSGRFPAPQEAHEPVAIAITKHEDRFVLTIGRLQLWLDNEELGAFCKRVNNFCQYPIGNNPPMGTWLETENGTIALTSGEAGAEPRFVVLRESGAFQNLTSKEFLNLEGVLSWAMRKYGRADIPSVTTSADSAAVAFARLSESMLTMGHGLVHLDPPLYKLELGEFAAEPLDYYSLAVLYQNAKRVLESPVPTTKVFDTTAGRTSISSFHLNKDSANLNYSFACDSDVQALSKAQLGELVSGLGVLAWEPPTAELEAEQSEPAADETVPFNPQAVREYLAGCVAYWRGKRDEGDELAKCYVDAFQSVHSSLFGELVPSVETQSEPAADGITMLNGWLGASYFQPLTVTLDPLALTINNIVAQLARLSAVAGIAWENQPQPLVKGGE